MKNRSLFAKSLSAQIFCGLLIAVASLTLSSCHSADYYYYKFPQYTFANRPVPPSKLAQRVMVSYTANGISGRPADARRQARYPQQHPEHHSPLSHLRLQLRLPQHDLQLPGAGPRVRLLADRRQPAGHRLQQGNARPASAGKYPGASSIAIPPTFNHYYATAKAAGQFIVVDNTTGGSYALNLPDVDKVVVNQGDTVVLAMVRNSNTIYRLVKLNSNQFPTATQAIQSTGAADCQPVNLPVYCIVPVNPGGSASNFDRPVGAYFSLDGSTAYILNCGPECGGITASLTLLKQGLLNVNSIPTSTPDTSAFISNVPVPGGVTVALSDATTLYVAGQQQMPDGLFTGYLSTIDLAAAATSPSTAITGKYSISDGNHSKLLFADDNTLWIGSQFCATGERQKLGQNYNCLTRFDRGAKTAQIIPNVTPGGATTVPYPNTNQNLYYYGRSHRPLLGAGLP